GGDYQRAAFGITVARWTPSFNEKAPIQKILTWVRLPKLPIHYFNPTTVERIVNHIGRTIKLDLATAEGAWARYARVCVEVDLSKPLLGKYMVDDRIMYIEYEILDKICYSCGMYGHKLDSCPLNSPHDTDIPTETEPEPLPEKEVEGDSGSWMTVTRRIIASSLSGLLKRLWGRDLDFQSCLRIRLRRPAHRGPRLLKSNRNRTQLLLRSFLDMQIG
ncbi:hypothetical protein LINPERHAP1_LOCUS17144, partial [Linum perenne]